MNARMTHPSPKALAVASLLALWATSSAGCMMSTDASGTRSEGVTSSSTPADNDAPPAERSRATVCRRWAADYAAVQTLPAWTAERNACGAGTLADSTRAGALRMTNTFRWLAGLDPVTADAHDAEAAQACAVLTQANGQMTHTPAPSAACFSTLGYEGSSRSNIIGLSGSYQINVWAAVGGWMDEARDLSNTLGHRRWILSPELSVVGYGQTRGFACLYVLDDRIHPRTRDPVAWPSEGYFPVQAMTRTWSVSSMSLGLSASTRVAVTVDGHAVAVQAALRAPGAGDDTVSWVMPAITANQVVRVQVTGVRSPMDYTVRPVDCR